MASVAIPRAFRTARAIVPAPSLEAESFAAIRSKIESIRLAAGPLMNLGDVKEKSVPKMFLVAPPRDGGAICTRSFIPHRAHATIGVLGAVSVATACLIPGSPAAAALRRRCVMRSG